MLQAIRPIPTSTTKDKILTAAVERLRQAAAAAYSTETECADGIADALGKLEAAFRQHRTAARSAEGGVLAEVDETTATVARQADEVRDKHDDLLIQIVELRDEIRKMVKAAVSDTDLGAIRECAENLLTELEKNRHVETTLLQDSVNTDIGVGD